jgi:hypothetical protein
MARGVKVDFNADVARFTSGIDKALNDLSRFQTNADRTSKNINTVLGNIGVGLSVTGVVAFGKSVIDGLDKLNDLSKTTSLAVGTLAGLGVAAKQSGTDLDSVANAVSKLSVNIGKDGDKFRALGISAKDPIEAFKQLSDIFVAIKDPQERAAVAAAALGKSWQETAPLLSEGGAAIRRMVTEGERASGVTKEMAEQADKFNDQLELMKAKVGGVTISIVGGFLPAMNSLLDKVRTASQSGGLFSFMTSSNSEEANAQATIDSLKTKVGSMKKLRDELTAPTLANKLNNTLLGSLLGGGTSDLKTINSQIAATENKISYLQALIKDTSKQADDAATVKAPSASSISAFLGNDGPGKDAAKAALAAAKKAAEEQAKIFKAGLDFETHQKEQFYDGQIKAAHDAQASLDALQKEGKSLAESVDPLVKRNDELERYVMLLDKGVISQDTFDKASTKSINDAESKLKGSVDDMTSILIGFQTNVQSTLGTGLYNIMSGNFTNIGDAFAQMMKRMLADALAAKLSSAIFGKDGGASLLKAGLSVFSSLLSFGGGAKGIGSAPKITSGGSFGLAAKGASFADGVAKFALGGIVSTPTPFQFASGGGFHNGLMGEAGPEAIMPLKRDSAGRLGVSAGGSGSKSGVVINNNQVINIDSRSDRASVIQDVRKMIKQGNAELVDTLDRQGRM